MRRPTLALLLLAAAFLAPAPLALVTPGFAAPVADTFADPRMEARARALQRQLRCLVCQGESLDESNAPLAADLRHLVRQQMAQGKSDEEIKDFLVVRYGDFILMQPPVQPNTYLLWTLPFMVLLTAGGVAFWVVSRARKAAESGDFDIPA